MIAYPSGQKLSKQIAAWRERGESVGFVPTMGALHKGHATLCSMAKAQADRVVVSIFVNPTQFHDSQDLEKYPRTIDQDLATLSALGVDAVYLPEVREIYPADYKQPVYALGPLEKVMEGVHRPGHFQGVAAVLDRFFQLLPVNMAFFGEKDFQQLEAVHRLVAMKGHEISVVGCPTIREECGLAMSSRNMRLSAAGRETACSIYKGFIEIKKATAEVFEPDHLEQTKKNWEALGMEVEYLELAHATTFESARQGDSLALRNSWRLFAAAHVEGVRLIDNLALKS
ncbi:MAG: pantoate--beta-alanine ligase [Flavobacteriia bacterium]|nr:pantoate--beta-alanine ligase [Flavobacteriia bacterium]